MVARSGTIAPAFLAALALGACAHTQHAPAGTTSATHTEITEGDLAARLYAFAHDSMMGRATGSEGDFKASAYVAEEFRRLGLTPAGENGTYFQTVPFVQTSVAALRVLGTANGPLEPWQEYAPVRADLPFRALDGVQSVFGGIAGDTSSWLSAAQATGKLVVFSIGVPAGTQRSYLNPNLVFGNRRLATAAGIAIAELDVAPAAALAAMKNLRAAISEPGAASIPARLLVSPAGAARLLGASVGTSSAGTPGSVVRGEMGVTRAPVLFPARNVVAILPGSDPRLKGEYVALTAHNDHVGVTSVVVDHDSLRAYNRVMRPMGVDTPDRPPSAAQQAAIRTLLDSLRKIPPPRRDSIMNGADDDGSGTVSILEIAEALSLGRVHPRRSILFVSHTGEEVGLLGSRWYTDHATVPLDSIVAELDQDMVGRGRSDDLPEAGPAYMEVIGVRRLSTEYGDLFESVNARQPAPFKLNYTYDAPGHPLQYYCRADHFSYARYGIPSVAISRGEHLDYHQVTDEAQYIDYAALARVSRFSYDVALAVANLDHRPKLDKPKQDPKTPCRQ